MFEGPKIQKHTERLKVPGWDFISKFANKGKKTPRQKRKQNSSRKRSANYKIHEGYYCWQTCFWAPLAPEDLGSDMGAQDLVD